jgi:hypothetical protein
MRKLIGVLALADQPPSRSDTHVPDKLSSVSGEVVFDLLSLAMCRSWLSWSWVMGNGDWGVFGVE